MLEGPVTMSFGNPTPLEDVLKPIKAATRGRVGSGIPVDVDPVASNDHVANKPGNFTRLKAQSLAEHTTVTLDLEGVPLKTSLRLLLKQLDLAYCVKDGLLIISSVQGVILELREAESAHQGDEDRKLDAEGGFQ